MRTAIILSPCRGMVSESTDIALLLPGDRYPVNEVIPFSGATVVEIALEEGRAALVDGANVQLEGEA